MISPEAAAPFTIDSAANSSDGQRKRPTNIMGRIDNTKNGIANVTKNRVRVMTPS